MSDSSLERDSEKDIKKNQEGQSNNTAGRVFDLHVANLGS